MKQMLIAHVMNKYINILNSNSKMPSNTKNIIFNQPSIKKGNRV